MCPCYNVYVWYFFYLRNCWCRWYTILWRSLQTGHTDTWQVYVLEATHRKYPKFSDRHVWANSVTQIRLLFRVYTVCYCVYIFWPNLSKVKTHNSNFRMITANFSGVQIFRIFKINLTGEIVFISKAFSNACSWIIQYNQQERSLTFADCIHVKVKAKFYK